MNYNNYSRNNNKTNFTNDNRRSKTESPLVEPTLNEEFKKGQEELAPPNEPKTVKVINTSRLNLRKNPDINSDIKMILNHGDKLLMDGLSNGWANVYTKDGVQGFVMMEFIEEV